MNANVKVNDAKMPVGFDILVFLFTSDGGDGLSSCHQPDGSPAGVQLNHLRQGAPLCQVASNKRQQPKDESQQSFFLLFSAHPHVAANDPGKPKSKRKEVSAIA